MANGFIRRPGLTTLPPAGATLLTERERFLAQNPFLTAENYQQALARISGPRLTPPSPLEGIAAALAARQVSQAEALRGRVAQQDAERQRFIEESALAQQQALQDFDLQERQRKAQEAEDLRNRQIAIDRARARVIERFPVSQLVPSPASPTAPGAPPRLSRVPATQERRASYKQAVSELAGLGGDVSGLTEPFEPPAPEPPMIPFEVLLRLGRFSEKHISEIPPETRQMLVPVTPGEIQSAFASLRAVDIATIRSNGLTAIENLKGKREEKKQAADMFKHLSRLALEYEAFDLNRVVQEANALKSLIPVAHNYFGDEEDRRSFFAILLSLFDEEKGQRSPARYILEPFLLKQMEILGVEPPTAPPDLSQVAPPGGFTLRERMAGQPPPTRPAAPGPAAAAPPAPGGVSEALARAMAGGGGLKEREVVVKEKLSEVAEKKLSQVQARGRSRSAVSSLAGQKFEYQKEQNLTRNLISVVGLLSSEERQQEARLIANLKDSETRFFQAGNMARGMVEDALRAGLVRDADDLEPLWARTTQYIMDSMEAAAPGQQAGVGGGGPSFVFAPGGGGGTQSDAIMGLVLQRLLGGQGGAGGATGPGRNVPVRSAGFVGRNVVPLGQKFSELLSNPKTRGNSRNLLVQHIMRTYRTTGRRAGEIANDFIGWASQGDYSILRQIITAGQGQGQTQQPTKPTVPKSQAKKPETPKKKPITPSLRDPREILRDM